MQTLAEHWAQFDVRIAVAVFIVYVIIDGMYAYYTIAVTRKRPVVSATTGAFMHFLIAFGVLSYVENYLYLIPLALGSWVGTYLVAVRDVKNAR